MKTLYVKSEDIEKKWYIIDAAEKKLGRLAERVASILRGKHKPEFHPSVDCGDYVIVINSDKVDFSGKKNIQKKYFWHTNFPGGIKSISLEKLMEKDSKQVILKAVKGMLPGNKLGKSLLTNLRVYSDDKHQQSAQKPEKLEI